MLTEILHFITGEKINKLGEPLSDDAVSEFNRLHKSPRSLCFAFHPSYSQIQSPFSFILKGCVDIFVPSDITTCIPGKAYLTTFTFVASLTSLQVD